MDPYKIFLVSLLFVMVGCQSQTITNNLPEGSAVSDQTQDQGVDLSGAKDTEGAEAASKAPSAPPADPLDRRYDLADRLP